jgi:hypothetical protein
MSTPAKPRIYLSSPHMGTDELTLVQDAFATNWIAPLGPHVDKFEQEFAELVGKVHSAKSKDSEALSPSPLAPSAPQYAAALSSGTAALHLAMRWLKLQPGDEVICSTLTFSASVNPVLYERATPVFVDCDDISWNMAPALLAEAVEDRIKRGKKPKAVILVHLYGQSADIDPIAATCAKHGIPLIEDAAEALGAVYYGTKAKPETGNLKPEMGIPEPSGLRSQVSGLGHTPRRCAGQRGPLRHPLFQRQQDHHHVGWGHADFERPEADREGAVLGYAGTRSGAALPAFGNRLQLPYEQCAGGDRSWPAARA